MTKNTWLFTNNRDIIITGDRNIELQGCNIARENNVLLHEDIVQRKFLMSPNPVVPDTFQVIFLSEHVNFLVPSH